MSKREETRSNQKNSSHFLMFSVGRSFPFLFYPFAPFFFFLLFFFPSLSSRLFVPLRFSSFYFLEDIREAKKIYEEAKQELAKFVSHTYSPAYRKADAEKKKSEAKVDML